MALTTEGALLTEAHRQSQINVRTDLLRDLLILWPLLNLEDFKGSLPAYLVATTALVQQSAQRSTAAALAYYAAFRAAEQAAPTDVASLLRAAPVATDLIRAMLLTTGPIAFNDAMRRGRGRVKAAEDALTATSGSVTKLALTGGRAAIAGAIARDPVALGYARVTDGDPCYWCAMLSSRGAVYTEGTVLLSSAGKEYHDHCACTSEPIYSSADYVLPGRGDEFREMYETATQDAGYGRDKVNAFRRYYENSRSDKGRADRQQEDG